MGCCESDTAGQLGKGKRANIGNLTSKGVEFKEDSNLGNGKERLETNEEEYTSFRKPENPRTTNREPENEPALESTPPPKKQVQNQAFLKIKVPEIVSVKELHEHNLRYVEDMAAENDGDAEWACNGIEIFKDGCKSGQKDIGVHTLSKAWRSVDDEADFDMCETCIQWALYCKSSGTSLNVGSVEELQARGIDLSGIDQALLETLSRSSVIKNLPEPEQNVSEEEWNARLEGQ